MRIHDKIMIIIIFIVIIISTIEYIYGHNSKWEMLFLGWAIALFQTINREK